MGLLWAQVCPTQAGVLVPRLTRYRPQRREVTMSADRMDPSVSRRSFLGGAAALAGVATTAVDAAAAGGASLAASPPSGFIPLAAPGKIVKVSKSNVLMPNGLFPKEESARAMLER